jgi:hypothetical protein
MRAQNYFRRGLRVLWLLVRLPAFILLAIPAAYSFELKGFPSGSKISRTREPTHEYPEPADSALRQPGHAVEASF